MGKNRKAPELRFVVGSEGGPRSAVWNVWVQGEDTYVAQRPLARQMKVSLHASGKYRSGLTEIGAAEHGLPPDKDRALAKWDPPSEAAPGARLMFTLVFPREELRPGTTWHPADKKPTWRIPPPRFGHAHHVQLIHTEPGVTTGDPREGWPGLTSMGSTFVGVLSRRDGGHVWVVVREMPLTVENRAKILAAKGPMQAALRSSGKPAPEPRGFVSFADPAIGQFMVDVSLEPQPGPVAQPGA